MLDSETALQQRAIHREALGRRKQWAIELQVGDRLQEQKLEKEGSRPVGLVGFRFV